MVGVADNPLPLHTLFLQASQLASPWPVPSSSFPPSLLFEHYLKMGTASWWSSHSASFPGWFLTGISTTFLCADNLQVQISLIRTNYFNVRLSCRHFNLNMFRTEPTRSVPSSPQLLSVILLWHLYFHFQFQLIVSFSIQLPKPEVSEALLTLPSLSPPTEPMSGLGLGPHPLS